MKSVDCFLSLTLSLSLVLAFAIYYVPLVNSFMPNFNSKEDGFLYQYTCREEESCLAEPGGNVSGEGYR